MAEIGRSRRGRKRRSWTRVEQGLDLEKLEKRYDEKTRESSGGEAIVTLSSRRRRLVQKRNRTRGQVGGVSEFGSARPGEVMTIARGPPPTKVSHFHASASRFYFLLLRSSLCSSDTPN